MTTNIKQWYDTQEKLLKSEGVGGFSENKIILDNADKFTHYMNHSVMIINGLQISAWLVKYKTKDDLMHFINNIPENHKVYPYYLISEFYLSPITHHQEIEYIFRFGYIVSDATGSGVVD